MARFLKRFSSSFIWAAAFLFVTPAMAQSLDEYKTAVSNIGKGCESIPFSTLRSRCIDSEKETDKWCYEEKWKCDKDTDGLIASINGMKKKVDDLNDQRYRASSDDEKRKLDDQIKE